MEDEGPDQGTPGDELPRGRRVTTIGDDDEQLVSGWVSAAVIVIALAANYAVFRHFGASYFDWYVTNGSKFAIALGLLSLAIKLDDEPGVIAAHPSDYVGAWFSFFGQGFLWLGNILEPGSSESGSVPFWDDLVTILFSLAWAAAAFAWLAVVVPAQYCVTLVCGAPVRLTLATPHDVIIETREPRHPRPGRRWLSTRTPRIQVGLNIRERPVTATAAISAAALFALSLAV